MYEQIINSILQFVSLEQEEIDYFISKLVVKSFDKKDLILEQGQTCNYCYFVNKGSMRYFYLVDGNENTAQFFFENNWYTDFESFLSGKSSKINIQAMEKTELLMLSKTHIEQIYSEYPKFEKFGRKMAENAFLGVRKRNEMLENLTAEERYLSIIKERPKVFERIPQRYIASYIGIHPESLSRIRKMMSER